MNFGLNNFAGETLELIIQYVHALSCLIGGMSSGLKFAG